MNVQGIRIEKPVLDEPRGGLTSVPQQPERPVMSWFMFAVSFLSSAFSVALALMVYSRRVA